MESNGTNSKPSVLLIFTPYLKAPYISIIIFIITQNHLRNGKIYTSMFLLAHHYFYEN